jgi:uncharacterized protein YecE (DUF72 family)
MGAMGRIRIGVGGWVFAPWRETFYPPGLSAAKQLAHASRALTAIEINATFHRTQSPESFAKWADETPDDFVFAVKASRASTNRTVLAEAGQSIGWFLGSGLDQLGDKLGPILWQLAATKRFDAADLAAFLGLLPRELGGRPLRHAVEAEHASFSSAEALGLMQEHNVAKVLVDGGGAPPVAEITADFVYLRLKGCRSEEACGYAEAELGAWAGRLSALATGEAPPGLAPGAVAPRAGEKDVFAFVISGAKERAPPAAQALIARLAGAPPGVAL